MSKDSDIKLKSNEMQDFASFTDNQKKMQERIKLENELAEKLLKAAEKEEKEEEKKEKNKKKEEKRQAKLKKQQEKVEEQVKIRNEKMQKKLEAKLAKKLLKAADKEKKQKEKSKNSKFFIKKNNKDKLTDTSIIPTVSLEELNKANEPRKKELLISKLVKDIHEDIKKKNIRIANERYEKIKAEEKEIEKRKREKLEEEARLEETRQIELTEKLREEEAKIKKKEELKEKKKQEKIERKRKKEEQRQAKLTEKQKRKEEEEAKEQAKKEEEIRLRNEKLQKELDEKKAEQERIAKEKEEQERILYEKKQKDIEEKQKKEAEKEEEERRKKEEALAKEQAEEEKKRLAKEEKERKEEEEKILSTKQKEAEKEKHKKEKELLEEQKRLKREKKDEERKQKLREKIEKEQEKKKAKEEILLKKQQEKNEKLKQIEKEKKQAREEKKAKAELIKKAREDARQKARAEKKPLSELVNNWYNNLSFVKDAKNKKELQRETLLLDVNSEESQRSDEKIMYKYVAKNPETGKVETGYFGAFSKLDVHSFLLAEGYEVYEITPQTNFKGAMGLKKAKISANELDFFLTQLSTFLRSGITLVESVKILSKQTSKVATRNLYKSLVYELSMGENFSEAMDKQGTVFPKLLINMVKTAELTGDLPATLDDMANYYRETNETKKQMMGALTYPLVVLTFAVSVLIYIMVVVIPQFVGIYDSLDADLPGITVVIIKVSNFLQAYWLWLIVGLVIFIVIFILLYRSIKVFKTVVQSFVMNIPVMGKIIIYNEVTMFTKTFASLLNHSVYITDCMEVLSKITDNEIYKMLIFDTITNLAKGEAISNSFKGHWAFPTIAYEMILTGEKTGQLGTMMDKVAKYYQMQHKQAVNQIKAFIEPVLIVSLAFIVGVVLLSVVLPMFDMYQNIGA